MFLISFGKKRWLESTIQCLSDSHHEEIDSDYKTK